jgi:hypothetical protein
MEKYGWEKVRGACWCSLEIKKPDFEKNKKSKPKKIIKLISHENDVNIKYLYCIKQIQYKQRYTAYSMGLTAATMLGYKPKIGTRIPLPRIVYVLPTSNVSQTSGALKCSIGHEAVAW